MKWLRYVSVFAMLAGIGIAVWQAVVAVGLFVDGDDWDGWLAVRIVAGAFVLTIASGASMVATGRQR